MLSNSSDSPSGWNDHGRLTLLRGHGATDAPSGYDYARRNASCITVRTPLGKVGSGLARHGAGVRCFESVEIEADGEEALRGLKRKRTRGTWRLMDDERGRRGRGWEVAVVWRG
ncbi:hypothetical protein HETIRDRAFT_432247 [Heterobasidion irregulare TC 32-1]|uniref:Uncharacterized protein n=1 Tax=Heterobasidion irregulare (strain TC 32-1) TaxID=747525 RepID=W4KI35_HETIT|nr:uncharacterized protein HETIRDRAFT_432247 [Heterobasidion irregulare TC 32-1]ETW85523.1 hypothetical protein HETIRDRAFT_432247 [Heterobasidion irregulare TC 32-1]